MKLDRDYFNLNLYNDWNGVFGFRDFENDCPECGCPPRRKVLNMAIDEAETTVNTIKALPWWDRLLNNY